MAKTQAEAAGTSGSQFFVVTAQDAQLPPDYAFLGKVTSGGAVVDKISRVKTDPNTEAPVKKVTINSIKVSEQ
jgi:cyclophilin family peptidyl-prolyl cis-trans isomerase